MERESRNLGMSENRERGCTCETIKLLIISTNGDPKAELPFSGEPQVTWTAVTDALIHARYYYAIRSLPTPPNNHRGTRTLPARFCVLRLNPRKKEGFFYSGHNFRNANYQITYDENLMNDLPCYLNLKDLPNFHLFTSLPDDLQLRIVDELDGISFARLRCVNRRFRRLDWSRDFNILKYSYPKMDKQSMENDENGGGGGYCLTDSALFRLASAVCFGAVLCCIANEVRCGVCVYNSDEEEEYKKYVTNM